MLAKLNGSFKCFEKKGKYMLSMLEEKHNDVSKIARI